MELSKELRGDKDTCCIDGTCEDCVAHLSRVDKYLELSGDHITAIGLARLDEMGFLTTTTVDDDGHIGIGLNHEAGHLFVALSSVFGATALAECDELKSRPTDLDTVSDETQALVRAMATASAYKVVRQHVVGFIEDNAARMLVDGVDQGIITDVPDDVVGAARERARVVDRKNVARDGWASGVLADDFEDIAKSRRKSQRKRDAEDKVSAAMGTGGYL